jgi:hypothetical protein
MVKLLGVISSGISVALFAIQVGDGVIKLKDFWDAVHNALEDIKYLLDELETLSLILADIGTNDEQRDLRLIGQKSERKCLQLCQKWSILEGVVREFKKMGKGKGMGDLRLC